MKYFKIFSVITILLFSFVIIAIHFRNEEQDIDSFLTKNTEYEWNIVSKHECINDSNYDEYVALETNGKEFKLHLYINEGEIEDATLVAREGYVGKLDSLVIELEELLNIDFYNNW